MYIFLYLMGILTEKLIIDKNDTRWYRKWCFFRETVYTYEIKRDTIFFYSCMVVMFKLSTKILDVDSTAKYHTSETEHGER